MTSNVGSASVYQADDQRTVKDEDIRQAKKDDRFHEGKKDSHNPDDPKDERSIANRLERESKRNKEEDESASGKKLTKEQKLGQDDPLAPAKLHGNEPSKGAKIDAEIQAEEEEILKKKGAFGPK